MCFRSVAIETACVRCEAGVAVFVVMVCVLCVMSVCVVCMLHVYLCVHVFECVVCVLCVWHVQHLACDLGCVMHRIKRTHVWSNLHNTHG